MTDSPDASTSLGEDYVARWNLRDPEALAAIYSPECQYKDISWGIGFEGLEGIREMVVMTVAAVPDYEMTFDGGFEAGEQFVVEWTLYFTAAGERLSSGGVSIGTVDAEGRILTQRDYWDTREFVAAGLGVSHE